MNKWFKILGISVMVALIVSAIAGVALAQGPIDEDGDGLCDVCGEETGDGLGRGWRSSTEGQTDETRVWRNNDQMPCDDFVDEDGDGVCDLCGEKLGSEVRNRQFSQTGEPQWQDRGPLAEGEQACDDFVDEDGDGVCDNHDENVREPLSGYPGRGGMGRGRGTYGPSRP